MNFNSIEMYVYLEKNIGYLYQGNEVQQIVVRHSELNQQIADKKTHHFIGLDQFLDVL